MYYLVLGFFLNIENIILIFNFYYFLIHYSVKLLIFRWFYSYPLRVFLLVQSLEETCG